MEKQLYKTNYSVAINWCNNDYVMCNNLPQIDSTVWNNMVGMEYLMEEGEYDDPEDMPEIYQWFITNASNYDVNYLTETFPGLVFTYSELLDLYVLCVTHYGTAWDYVGWMTTNVNAKAELGQKKHGII